MVAVPAKGVEAFLADPPAAIRLFLFYGSDAGTVTERARKVEALARLRGADAPLRLGSDEIGSDPGRIADEAFAASLFGGTPLVTLRVLDGRHNVMAALEPVLARVPDEAVVIVEAGDLRADNALRKAFEQAPHAAAIACREAESADIAALVREVAAESEVTVDAAALDYLVGHLGSDRMAARGEVEKLVLFAGPGGRIGLEEVEALTGDNAMLRAERIIDAALLGAAEIVEVDLNRLRAEGQSAATVAAQMLRHLLAMQEYRADVEAGRAARTVLERARPPIFFKRLDQVEAALRRWPSSEIARARRILSDAVLATRRQPALEFAVVSDALQRIAGNARRLSARRG
ncbi:DNA polymerase III subunit delta [Propylenella binzhouense]|uniref:DNA-directed DNA polymerase n=1 Tax=Propylenella binzhouense TaxID=2555902 RepID=A0A964WSI2_9HYPH|nr:DNA polymerase III subunit delta [Propylenella binzhouense]MYZ46835.1 DNA polymerase III subunit delta [Propylenella binzhouense]